MVSSLSRSIADNRLFAFIWFAFALLACLTCSVDVSAKDAGKGTPCDVYDQQLKIVFASEEAAKKAQLRIEPLFDGHHRAVSCRWDDNWTSDNEKTREIMEEYGIKGTWYLNDRYFVPGGEPADYLPIARKLIAGGNSVGGHSMTHPYITYYHSNRMFAETSGVRVVWESELDRPVSSYAYSFVDLRPLPEGKQVLMRSLKSLELAGIYHIAEFVHFFDDIELDHELSPILPPENQPIEAFEQAIGWLYNDANIGEHSPMISNSMHAWYGTNMLNYEYDEFHKRMKLLSALENVWHCNQNEYAAYRKQFRHANLADTKVDGREVTVNLKNRPRLLDVDDTTALTFAIAGVTADQVEQVVSQTAEVIPSGREDTNYRFHLAHNRDQHLPTKIGRIANPSNAADLSVVDADADFPQLKGILQADGGKLRLQLAGPNGQMLKNVRVVWRAPLGWNCKPTRMSEASVSSNESLECTLEPSGFRQHRLGKAHFVAQMDFELDGVPGRIHFTCQRQGDSPDDSWPLDHFAVLGPIPKEQIDIAKVAAAVEKDGCPESWSLSDGSTIAWRNAPRDGYVTHEWLSPEYVRTQGTWDVESPTYLLRSKVTSPAARKVRFVLSHASLTKLVVNGKIAEGDQSELIEGENTVLILYPGTSMTPENRRMTACFVRLADPQSGERLEDLKFKAY